MCVILSFQQLKNANLINGNQILSWVTSFTIRKKKSVPKCQYLEHIQDKCRTVVHCLQRSGVRERASTLRCWKVTLNHLLFGEETHRYCGPHKEVGGSGRGHT